MCKNCAFDLQRLANFPRLLRMQSLFLLERLVKSKFEARKVAGMNAEMCHAESMG